MICTKCGSTIAENALFCTFCGQPTGVSAPAQSVPVMQEIPQSVPVMQEIPQSAPVMQEAPQSVPAQPAAAVPPMNAYAQPAAEPQSAPNRQSGAYVPAEPPAIDQKPEKPEKYYTFGHIALCLAAVAVMAIVAGVFAGLYFSVV